MARSGYVARAAGVVARKRADPGASRGVVDTVSAFQPAACAALPTARLIFCWVTFRSTPCRFAQSRRRRRIQTDDLAAWPKLLHRQQSGGRWNLRLDQE